MSLEELYEETERYELHQKGYPCEIVRGVEHVNQPQEINMITLQELKERMQREDEVTLLEILDINSEDLVEAFEHRIDARYEILVEEYGEENEED